MGKLRGKVIKTGDGGMLKYKNDAGEKVECPYDQPFSKELGIAENTVVTFELVTGDKGQVAVAVNPVENGQIQDINFDAGTGHVIETESGIVYPFKQNYLKESKFDKGMNVRYTLVNVNGSMMALCLTLVQ